jgi:hypothetical protein
MALCCVGRRSGMSGGQAEAARAARIAMGAAAVAPAESAQEGEAYVYT